jgi:hypothetical protein
VCAETCIRTASTDFTDCWRCAEETIGTTRTRKTSAGSQDKNKSAISEYNLDSPPTPCLAIHQPAWLKRQRQQKTRAASLRNQL